MESLKIKFVLPSNCKDQSEVSNIMQQAFEACRQYVKNVSWMNEEESVEVDSVKTHVVIFEQFNGKLFGKFKESKCVIVGPWCVLVCLTEGRSIPNFPWPIYNVAMYNCIISCSHLSKTKKNEIKENVQLMGGCYSETLLNTITHLITDSVQSEKYVKAAEAGIKLMLYQWIDAVWNASQSSDIHCDNTEFNKYRCLPFHNLTICTTGITNTKQRSELCKLITGNGGVFSGSLHLANTHVLVCYGVEGSTSAKYKAARNSANIHCVTIDWITDSVQKGYALPCHLYSVKPGTSTPSKDGVNPNFSVMSAIVPVGISQKSTLEETVNASSISSNMGANKRKCSLKEDVVRLIDGLDIKKAKKAGQYLDGCSVYIAGFDLDQREKLCKVLNLSGATRYDDVSDRLTHIIVGDPNSPDVSLIKSKNIPCPLVTVHWLIDSIDKKYPVDEEIYLINTSDIGKETINSPLSQKGLNLLRTDVALVNGIDVVNIETLTTKTFDLETDAEDHIMQQYLQAGNSEQETDTLAQLLKNADSNFVNPGNVSINEQLSEDDDTLSQQSNNIFKGYKFLLCNFDSETYADLKEQIEMTGGQVVSKSYKKALDFVVAPIFNSSVIKHTAATEIVNSFWILECIQENQYCEIIYYHRPFVINNTKPLKNFVVTISSYCNYERKFLKDLIEALGGVFQEQFARVTCVEKNVIGSTHLISLEASGKKYSAALKWGLPVVNKDWLLECAKTGEFVNEEEFLVGNAKTPIKQNSLADKGNPEMSTLMILKSRVTKSLTDNRIQDNVPSCSRQHEMMEGSNGHSLSTPANKRENKSFENSENTPLQYQQQHLKDAIDVCSQVTPVNKIMQEIRNSNLLDTPESPKNTPPTATGWLNLKTPETPLGRFIRPNPSPSLRKEMLNYINQFPDFVPIKPKRQSTPLSELKRRYWSKLLPKSSQNSPDVQATKTADDDDDEDKQSVDGKTQEDPNLDSQNLFVNKQLKQLEDMLAASSASNRRNSRHFRSTISMPIPCAERKDSQPFTVGWDYMDQDQKEPSHPIRIFIISGLENDLRQSIVTKLEGLGATVSDLLNYDPACTHLICPKPARNEKILSCMASGKWILHVSYVDKCVEAGEFLDEEDFEFGNPKSKINVSFDRENEVRMQSMHWWRKEIRRRGYGAFNDMRAIVVAVKREPIIRVIEAGGGVVIDVRPPFEDTVHATHCLLEQRTVTELSDYLPLVQQGIHCVNTSYISDFLHKTSKDIRDCILPYFAKYYRRS